MSPCRSAATPCYPRTRWSKVSWCAFLGRVLFWKALVWLRSTMFLLQRCKEEGNPHPSLQPLPVCPLSFGQFSRVQPEYHLEKYIETRFHRSHWPSVDRFWFLFSLPSLDVKDSQSVPILQKNLYGSSPWLKLCQVRVWVVRYHAELHFNITSIKPACPDTPHSYQPLSVQSCGASST